MVSFGVRFHDRKYVRQRIHSVVQLHTATSIMYTCDHVPSLLHNKTRLHSFNHASKTRVGAMGHMSVHAVDSTACLNGSSNVCVVTVDIQTSKRASLFAFKFQTIVLTGMRGDAV